MSTYYINESTSVVFIDGYSFLPTESSIVYVSSSREKGHVVTIMDQTGYISTPKRIVVSSTDGVSLSTGISSIVLDQRFSYLTLLSLTNTSWTFVNTPPLFGAGSNPSILGCDVNTVFTSSATAITTVSTVQTVPNAFRTRSTDIDVLTTVSSMGVNTTNPGPYTQKGALRVTGGIDIQGGLSVLGVLSVTQSVAVTGSISTAGAFIVQSNLGVGGHLSAHQAVVTVGGSITSLGTCILEDILYVNANVSSKTIIAAPTISSFQALCSTLDTTSTLVLGTVPIMNTDSGFFYTTATNVPSVIVRGDGIAVTNDTATSTITLRSFVDCESLTDIVGSTLAILNPKGSLQISSVTLSNTQRTSFSTLQATTTHSSDTIQTQYIAFTNEPAGSSETILYADGTTSTIPIQFSISSLSTNVNTLNAAQKFLSTTIFSVDDLQTFSFGAPTLNIQELRVSTFGIGTGLTYTGPDLIVPNARFQNDQGLLSTLYVSTNAVTANAPVTITTLRTETPFTLFNTAATAPGSGVVTFVSTNVFAQEFLSTQHIVVGTPPNPGVPVSPTIVQTDLVASAYIPGYEVIAYRGTYPLVSYPWQYKYGYGNFYNPTRIRATRDYEQVWSLYDIDPEKRVYLNAEITVHAPSTNFTQTFAAPALYTPPVFIVLDSEFSANVNGTTYAFSNTIPKVPTSCNFVLYDFDITDIPLTGVNPVTSDATPYIQFKGYGFKVKSYYLDSIAPPIDEIITDYDIRARVWLSYSTTTADYTTQSSFLNSNEGIFFRNGPLRFTSSQNATTIYNDANDIQTRNLTYTGRLFTPSDSTLKEAITYANLSTAAAPMRDLPLRHYSYTPAYISTFEPTDRSRLGFITTDVQTVFPNAVSETSFEYCSLSTLNMVDSTEIKMTHLAATKALIEEIDTLKEDLRYLYSLVEADERDR